MLRYYYSLGMIIHEVTHARQYQIMPNDKSNIYKPCYELCSEKEDVYLGEDKEHLVIFAKNNEKNNGPKYDFYIFGHRHIELDLMINAKSRVIILGNWINKYTFGVLEEGNFWLDNFFEDDENVNCCDLSNVV